MIAYWNNVIWGMASQFFWEREQGQLQLYLITPVSRMSILLGMALGGMAMTTTRAAAILTGGILLFHVSLPLERALPAFGLFLLTLGAAYSLGMILSSLFLLWGREVWHTATILQEPVYLLSGFYFPVSAMGVGIAIVGSILPVTLGLDGIRAVFLMYAIAKPLATTLILFFMVRVVSQGHANAETFRFIFIGNTFFLYVTEVLIGISWTVFRDREDYETLKYIYVAPVRLLPYLLGRAFTRVATATLGVTVALLF